MSPIVIVILVCVGLLVVASDVLIVAILARKAHIWLPAYVAGASGRKRRRRARAELTTDVMVAFVDHFEPVVKPGQDPNHKAAAMADWAARFPRLASRHRDSDGRPPRHTWTYPIEAYRPDYIEQLVAFCRQGLGEVEVHVHHKDDTSETFRALMLEGLSNFAEHGVSVVSGVGGYRFGFVHGDWALDNSLPGGARCGVNDELTILRELGCFADATLPSAPSPAQTRKINAIYYATDDPSSPKSHDSGVDVAAGREPSGDLMIIQGPLLPDWSRRKFGLIPVIDNAAITGSYPGTPARVDAWVRLGIGVVGRPEWVFVKLHGHGATVGDRDAIIGDGADAMYGHLEREYGAGRYRLHYVTLREMHNIVKAAEAGNSGNAGSYRDFAIPPYVCQTEA